MTCLWKRSRLMPIVKAKKIHFKGTVGKLTVHDVLITPDVAGLISQVCVFRFWSYNANK